MEIRKNKRCTCFIFHRVDKIFYSKPLKTKSVRRSQRKKEKIEWHQNNRWLDGSLAIWIECLLSLLTLSIRTYLFFCETSTHSTIHISHEIDIDDGGHFKLRAFCVQQNYAISKASRMLLFCLFVFFPCSSTIMANLKNLE